MAELLLELFSEEIPSDLQLAAAKDLKTLMEKELGKRQLSFAEIETHCTARRLALAITGLESGTIAIEKEMKGPPVDSPPEAIEGFFERAKASNIIGKERRLIGEKEYYFAVDVEKAEIQDVLKDVITEIILTFPWPKAMRWGKNSVSEKPFRWIRPLRNILCLWNAEEKAPEIIPIEVAGLKGNDLSFGYRNSSLGDASFKVTNIADYKAQLRAKGIILDFYERLLSIYKEMKSKVPSEVKNIFLQLGGDKADERFYKYLDKMPVEGETRYNIAQLRQLDIKNFGILGEIAGLVEAPFVFKGKIDKEFDDLPQGVLKRTIIKNQKCLPVIESFDEDAKVREFLGVANGKPVDNGKQMIRGYEKVIRARLSDALYFWERDQETIPLSDEASSWLEDLGGTKNKPLDQRLGLLFEKKTVFFSGLGTQADRVKRLVKLSGHFEWLFESEQEQHQLRRAVLLGKADLTTELVGEFPELQGYIGAALADKQQEDMPVCNAIARHYDGRHYAAHNCLGSIVAFCDRLDILVGFWLLNEKPTSSKDPYALRQSARIVAQALHVVSFLALKQSRSFSLANFQDLLKEAINNYKQQGNIAFAFQDEAKCATLMASLQEFLLERFWNMCQKEVEIRIKEKNLRKIYQQNWLSFLKVIFEASGQDFTYIEHHYDQLEAFLNKPEAEKTIQQFQRLENLLESLGAFDNNLPFEKADFPHNEEDSWESFVQSCNELGEYLDSVRINDLPKEEQKERIQELHKTWQIGKKLGFGSLTLASKCPL